MRRKKQIRRIELLEVELSGCLARVASSSRQPLALIRRHEGLLFPGAGLLMGMTLARISARSVVARGVSAAMLLLRAQRLVFRWAQRA